MRRRVLQSILAVVAATVAALGIPLGMVSWQLVTDHTRNDVRDRLESIAAYVTDQRTEGSGPLEVSRLAIALPAGGQLRVELPGQPIQVIGQNTTESTYKQSYPLPDGGTLTLIIPSATLDSEHRNAILLVLAAIGASLALGTAIALVLARRLSQPARAVAERAARLGAGDFRVFGERYGIAEFDRVADVLDSSAVDIAALIARERDLAGDISHQLRTRLTGMALQLEELAGHPDPEVRRAAAAALDQTDQLVGVVDGLLANARSRRAAGAQVLSLTSELTAVAAEWRPRTIAVGRTLIVNCPPGVRVQATSLRLRESLGVLLDNAITHGAGTLSITVRPGERTVVIEVSDQGRGVPDALVGHIFDRGVSTASSTGIGLDLARAFVEADGGRLELRQASPPVFAIFLTADAGPSPR